MPPFRIDSWDGPRLPVGGRGPSPGERERAAFARVCELCGPAPGKTSVELAAPDVLAMLAAIGLIQVQSVSGLAQALGRMSRSEAPWPRPVSIRGRWVDSATLPAARARRAASGR